MKRVMIITGGMDRAPKGSNASDDDEDLKDDEPICVDVTPADDPKGSPAKGSDENPDVAPPAKGSSALKKRG